jgi:hypothetical protein
VTSARIAAVGERHRLEALNAFNHPLFPQPNITPTQTAFGTVVASTQDNYPRRVQVMATFLF